MLAFHDYGLSDALPFNGYGLGVHLKSTSKMLFLLLPCTISKISENAVFSKSKKALLEMRGTIQKKTIINISKFCLSRNLPNSCKSNSKPALSKHSRQPTG